MAPIGVAAGLLMLGGAGDEVVLGIISLWRFGDVDLAIVAHEHVDNNLTPSCGRNTSAAKARCVPRGLCASGKRPESQLLHNKGLGDPGARSPEELWPLLFEWVNGTGMDMSDIAIEVAPVDLAPGELGLIAKEKLLPGDILAWAPMDLLLTKKKAVDLWGELVEALPDRTAVALLLVHERFVRGAASKWNDYIDMLPRFDGDVAGPSFLWEPEEWDWLGGSDSYGASVAMRSAFEEEFADLSATLFAEHPADFPTGAFTEKHYLWAAAVVSSRAYGDDEDGTNLAIPPLVDFLNHKPGALQLTRQGCGIVAYAHQGYDPGEQVFVFYGPKSNAQLVSQYGFVDMENSYDAVFLRVGQHLELGEPHLKEKHALLAELLERMGQGPDLGIFKLSCRPRDWDKFLLPAVRVLALEREDQVPTTIDELVPGQLPRLEAAAWECLLQALDRRSSDYPASLEADRAELALENLPERHAMGLRLRVAEQELIALARTHAVEALEAQRSQLSAAA
eukprot:CAMPEP_0117516708 /NCGR_PEP_ID=MMETSP0784-20121206/31233_1 /TAXON_ID=39447 /ORGANISM="" /LENGTH=507 /DNA_ID=CAMNT_0005312561 /DNA_START=97 /DNA_END=1622 /DNA_ORIENTATION=-